MTFWKAFFRILERNPSKAMAALYWHATRRRVRARNLLRLTAAQAHNAYEYWIECIEDLEAVGSGCPAIMAGWSREPSFSVLLIAPEGTTSDQVRRVVTSVEQQYYPHWELLVVGPALKTGKEFSLDPRVRHILPTSAGVAAALQAGISAATGDFVMPLAHGQTLSPAALFRFAEALQRQPNAAILFGDEDELNGGKRTRAWFKPQWDPDMFLEQDYVTRACVVETGLARQSVPSADEPDSVALFVLLLNGTRAADGKVLHLPYVISHVATAPQPDHHQMDRARAVAEHGAPAGLAAVNGLFDSIKVVWPLPATPPQVTIIIPTRDKVDLLRACVNSVFEKTRYPDFELLIIDNGTREPDACAYLAELSRLPNVRVIAYDRPYNYSAINNFAVTKAEGSYLCLLNNDTEVVEPEWLTEMMRHAVRPGVGAVGAKLLYDDGSIQHAGVIVGVCDAAGHAHRFARSDQAGYFAQAHIVHQVSAVTAACLVVEKKKFEAVGGLDESRLAIAYNDVDLCLKLERAGWRNIYVPHAVLIHHESKSRGNDVAPENIKRYMRELKVLQDRWGTRDYADPRLNPNLDRYNETFILKV